MCGEKDTPTAQEHPPPCAVRQSGAGRARPPTAKEGDTDDRPFRLPDHAALARNAPGAAPALLPQHPPNGVKASIMLEETGLPYEAHLVDIMEGESKTPEFLSLNPN